MLIILLPPDTFKIQAHAMFFDTAFNSRQTVRTNIISAFTETAVKMCMYARCLRAGKRPSGRVVISECLIFHVILVRLVCSESDGGEI